MHTCTHNQIDLEQSRIQTTTPSITIEKEIQIDPSQFPMFLEQSLALICTD